MPFYELECKNCGHTEEKLLSFKQHETEAQNPPRCPKCNASMNFAIPTGTSFSLKGTGWASTNYENRSNKVDSKE